MYRSRLRSAPARGPCDPMSKSPVACASALLYMSVIQVSSGPAASLATMSQNRPSAGCRETSSPLNSMPPSSAGAWCSPLLADSRSQRAAWMASFGAPCPAQMEPAQVILRFRIRVMRGRVTEHFTRDVGIGLQCSGNAVVMIEPKRDEGIGQVARVRRAGAIVALHWTPARLRPALRWTVSLRPAPIPAMGSRSPFCPATHCLSPGSGWNPAGALSSLPRRRDPSC